ncbi:hypothetical protein [Vagococcus fluvialis]|uniref:hypothetical protein n=1 Tax=Vagococcus fluvialis TaxID=2738 RepID=UPI0037B190FA
MVEHSFDIGLGVYSVAPSPNHKKLSKTEYNDQLAINIAKNSNLPVEEVRECMRYGTSVCV